VFNRPVSIQDPVVKGLRNGKPLGAFPNMGTINHNVNIPPKFSPPTNLTELHKEYKEYKLLRKKDQMSSNMNAGSAAYIISTKWLGKYHDFILYD
jgi:hypothetical protein